MHGTRDAASIWENGLKPGGLNKTRIDIYFSVLNSFYPEELKAWGHQGRQGGHIILKSDGEPSIIAVREALAKYYGGKQTTVFN